MILSILEASGKDLLKIELRGLRRYFRGTSNYEKFDEVYENLRKNSSILNTSKGSIELYKDYIIVPKELLTSLIELKEKKDNSPHRTL